MTLVKMLLSGLASLWASQSFASSQTIGDLAVNLTNQMPPYTTMISGFAYIMGTAFVISGALKIKQHRESPQSAPAMGGPLFVAMGVLLVYLPSTVSYLFVSVFGSAESVTGMTLYYSATLMDGTATSNAAVPPS
jgi:hypothetical protein